MVELLIDIGFHTATNIGKITHHAIVIKLRLPDSNASLNAMAVQMAAFSCMVHQAMTITKIDFFSDGVHVKELLSALAKLTLSAKRAVYYKMPTTETDLMTPANR